MCANSERSLIPSLIQKMINLLPMSLESPKVELRGSLFRLLYLSTKFSARVAELDERNFERSSWSVNFSVPNYLIGILSSQPVFGY